jgi:hypothetical protein
LEWKNGHKINKEERKEIVEIYCEVISEEFTCGLLNDIVSHCVPLRSWPRQGSN